MSTGTGRAGPAPSPPCAPRSAVAPSDEATEDPDTPDEPLATSGPISEHTRVLQLEEPLVLDSGEVLYSPQVAYRTWGSRDHAHRAVLVCHALSGSADADSWWAGLIGPGRALDPQRDFILCSNVLGGCYGSSGPLSTDPASGRPYGPDFPTVTVRDMVRLQARWLDQLGVEQLDLVVGGSMGGMQVLEWAALYPQRVRCLAPMAVSARHSSWCIGISEVQRQAIRDDPDFKGGRYLPERPPARGLATARMLAMLSYRSWTSFEQRFAREQREDGQFQVASYLRYQGQKLVDRFDANSYLRLSEAMDSHDLDRDRPQRANKGGVASTIEHPTLVVSIDSDVLYPPAEQEELARHMPRAQLARLRSDHGHDGFLIEMEELQTVLARFRQQWQQPAEA